nr:MAG TPA: KilA-N domain [Caudoviricetes sp.]
MGKQNKKIIVQGVEISVKTINDSDYISLTDMTSKQEEGSKLIEKWLTNKNTVEYLGIWEEMNNPNFNSRGG